jgi:hypothetical protein
MSKKLTSKKDMIDFISNQYRYDLMSSWNNARGYAYNVKIHNLSSLSNEERNNLYEIVSDENLSSDFYDTINSEIAMWQESMIIPFGSHNVKQERRINVDGMSGEQITNCRKHFEQQGWTYDRCGTKIMTIYRHKDESIYSAYFNGRSGGYLVLGKWNGHNYCGSTWTNDREELEEMSIYEVKSIYNVLYEFKKLYDKLLEVAKNYAQTEVEEITETVCKEVTFKQFK